MGGLASNCCCEDNSGEIVATVAVNAVEELNVGAESSSSPGALDQRRHQASQAARAAGKAAALGLFAWERGQGLKPVKTGVGGDENGNAHMRGDWAEKGSDILIMEGAAEGEQSPALPGRRSVEGEQVPPAVHAQDLGRAESPRCRPWGELADRGCPLETNIGQTGGQQVTDRSTQDSPAVTALGQVSDQQVSAHKKKPHVTARAARVALLEAKAANLKAELHETCRQIQIAKADPKTPIWLEYGTHVGDATA
eukprot:CAMPEP_0180704808 /NCGR_PEP_ID=MMETSP1038_2-20121128/7344_1 /TAXON_ID=632150 /ORGANISM="Azadinium spinosum, Strain 3D9" /LENGTH=252 /DNA_ID=CAMNT_0022736647 /DNA_START=53 /DNA_END=807 /DNA_ORIENTATION=+